MGLLATALMAGVLASAALPAAAKTARDTVRTVKKISIGDEGIRIEDSQGKEVVDVDVNVRGNGVHIRSDDRRRRDRVRISGPVVIVDDEGSDLVRIFADGHVAKDERIEGDAVAVFGSLDIEGEVTGDAVAVFGSLRLGPGAEVGGDAVAVGGALEQDETSKVGGESVSLGLFSWSPSVPTAQMLVLSTAMCWVLSLILGWLLALLFPDRMLQISITASRRTAGSFFLGIASAPLVVIACVLLLITVIGIPFALLLPFAYVILVWAGQLAATYLLGCRIMRRPLGSGGYLGPVVAGSLFVAMFFVLGAVLGGPEGVVRTLALFFTMLGGLLITGLSTIGTGAVLLSRFGSKPHEPVASAPGAPAAPVASPAPTPAV